VKLAASSEAHLVRTATNNSEAHSLYLQGLYLWNKRDRPNLNKAIALFQQAIVDDSTYAQAYAGLAMAYAVVSSSSDIDANVMNTRAENAARHALAIDSTSAEAYAALGMAEMNQYHNAGAERDFRRAIEHDSTFASAHQWYGQLLTRHGRFDEGIAEGVRAQELDPQSRVIGTTLGSSLYQSRRMTAAESTIAKVLELDPAFTNAYRLLVAVRLAEGRNTEAIAAAKRSLEGPERFSFGVALLGVAYARNGETSQARVALRELLTRSTSGPVSAAGVSLLYEALGDRENAIRWLERGVKQHDPFQIWARGPLFDGLRSDPRGAALMARVESWDDSLPDSGR
jgi:tetratricopeptide (TPR) repeat protein